MKPQRLVLVIEPGIGPELPAELERAMELARRLGAQLDAIVLADEQLQRAARLPVAREIGLASAQRVPFETGDLEHQLAALQGEIERRLAATAGRFGVTWTVSVRSGPVKEQLIEAESAADWLALTGSSARSRRLSGMLFREPEILIRDVIVIRTVRPPPAEDGGTAVVAFQEPTGPVLELCRQLGRRLIASDRLAVFFESIPPKENLERGDTCHNLRASGWSPESLLQRIEQIGIRAAVVIPNPKARKRDREALERFIGMADLPVVIISPQPDRPA